MILRKGLPCALAFCIVLGDSDAYSSQTLTVHSIDRPEALAAPRPASAKPSHDDLFDSLLPRDRNPVTATVTACELRFGQLGIAQLSLRSTDPATIWSELDAKVRAAPQLFTRAPVVLDLATLPELPNVTTLTALLTAIREAGMVPVGLVHATEASDALAQKMDLALFGRLRDVVTTPTRTIAPSDSEKTPPAASKNNTPPKPAPAAPVVTRSGVVGMHHAQPVRSGQQVYARGRDLTLTAMVGNGAEVIADGSIHIYGALRGRALAGAQGDTEARIFCQNFQAELISIAGQYRVFEDMPDELRGKPVQAWLEGERLHVAALDP